MSRFNLNKTVVMIGMMGAGKTAVGAAVARQLDVPFIDSDHEIENAANTSIAEIFDKFGEAFFRRKESQVLTRLLDGPPCILSTGGGAFLQPENRAAIAAKGLSLWLKVDADLLWARVRHKTTRPLLQVADPRRKLIEMLQAREPIYAEAAMTVTADPSYSVQDMAERVIEALSTQPDVLQKDEA